MMFTKLLPVLLLSLGLVACSEPPTETPPPTTPAQNQPADKLPADAPTYLVATEASYAPFEFRNESGAIIGYDIDILTAIGEDQGFKVQFINQKWDGIFDTLDNGERAIVAAGVGYTEERSQKYALSNPYTVAPTLAVYTDKALDLKKFEDLKNLRIATQADTSHYKDVEKLKGGNADMIGTSTLYLALKELVRGNAQAVVGSAAVLRYYMTGEPNLEFRSFEYNLEGAPRKVVFVIKKDNTELLNKINTGLANIKKNGIYETINKKWFGTVLDQSQP